MIARVHYTGSSVDQQLFAALWEGIYTGSCVTWSFSVKFSVSLLKGGKSINSTSMSSCGMCWHYHGIPCASIIQNRVVFSLPGYCMTALYQWCVYISRQGHCFSSMRLQSLPEPNGVEQTQSICWGKVAVAYLDLIVNATIHNDNK